MEAPETLSAKAAATMAGVTTASIYAWLKQGKIEGQREGRSVEVLAESLQNYLARNPPSEEAPEVAAARAIVEGEAEADDQVGGEDEPDAEVTDISVQVAQRMVEHAVRMRAKRARDAERELLWLAVQELGLAKPERGGAAAEVF